MAKAKAPAAPPIDPTSPAIALEYQGGRTKRYVPARDLAGVDLGRIAYRRAADVERAARSVLVAPGEERVAVTRPGPATAKELRDLADELVSTGAFTRVEQAPAEDEPSTPDDSTQPAPPAEQPEA